MDRIEWNPPTDSFRDYESQRSKATEQTASEAIPILDKLIQKVDLGAVNTDRHIPSAEAVINKVVEVGESNRTIERILERKHEVKDSAGVKSERVQYAAKVGDLLGPTKQTLANGNQHRAGTSSEPKTGYIQQVLYGTSLNAYAIRYGFLSAILALIVATLTVTLFT